MTHLYTLTNQAHLPLICSRFATVCGVVQDDNDTIMLLISIRISHIVILFVACNETISSHAAMMYVW
jgi:hypothetical protein